MPTTPSASSMITIAERRNLMHMMCTMPISLLAGIDAELLGLLVERELRALRICGWTIRHGAEITHAASSMIEKKNTFEM